MQIRADERGRVVAECAASGNKVSVAVRLAARFSLTSLEATSLYFTQPQPRPRPSSPVDLYLHLHLILTSSGLQEGGRHLQRILWLRGQS